MATPYYWSEAHEQLFACNIQLLEVNEFCPEADSAQCQYNHWTCPCTNLNALASIAGCLNNTDSFTHEYFEPLFETCQKQNVTLTDNDMDKALAYFGKYRVVVGPNHYANVSTPIMIDPTFNKQYTSSMSSFLGNFNISTYFGAILLGYWGLVMLMGAIANWTKILFPGLLSDLNGKCSTWIRKHITLPAMHIKKTNSKRMGLVPSRYESFVIIIFIALVVVMCAIDINPPKDDNLFPNREVAVLRFIAGRCAVVCGMLVPLLILFASRNNILIWLTRWNYATFNTFHRWIGRVVFILAAVHAITFSYAMNSLGVTDYSDMMKRDYMIAGTVATVAAGLLIFQGFILLRRNRYELFVLVHILLAVAFIAGSWGHVAKFNHAQPYIAATAVWAFDRLIRAVRCISFGAPKATLTLIANETIKVSVPTRSWWRPRPGGYAFVYFWRPSCWWQSHPFTFNQSVVESDRIIFYCKVKGGMTHGLYQYLKQCPNNSATVRVTVEGPYGDPSPVQRYDNAVYVAGGNGIPGPFYEANWLAKKHADSEQTITLIWVIREYQSILWFFEELKALKDTKVQVVVYVTKPNSIPFDPDEWTRIRGEMTTTEKRQSAFYRLAYDVKSTDKKSFDIVDFTDNSSSVYEDDEYSICDMYSVYGRIEENKRYTNRFSRHGDPILEEMKRELSFVHFFEGRPSMYELVRHTIHPAEGTVGFVACGHPVMVDDLRQACIDNLDKGSRIDFFEHLQVWA